MTTRPDGTNGAEPTELEIERAAAPEAPDQGLRDDPRYQALLRRLPPGGVRLIEPRDVSETLWWGTVVMLSVAGAHVRDIARALKRTKATIERVLATPWARQEAERIRPEVQASILRSTLDARQQFIIAAPRMATLMVESAETAAKQKRALHTAMITEKALAIAGVAAPRDPPPDPIGDDIRGLSEEELRAFAAGESVPERLQQRFRQIEGRVTPHGDE
jgi:hypothetical protein